VAAIHISGGSAVWIVSLALANVTPSILPHNNSKHAAVTAIAAGTDATYQGSVLAAATASVCAADTVNGPFRSQTSAIRLGIFLRLQMKKQKLNMIQQFIDY
jgi:hypothetical protein